MSRWMQYWTAATVLWFIAFFDSDIPVDLRVAFGCLAIVLYAVGWW